MALSRFAATAAALVLAGPIWAEEFRQIADRSQFLNLIEGRDLTRLGIRLQVGRSGEIRGKAFGRDVTGAWKWNDGFFCRDLYFGERDLGPNCQMVKVRGEVMRFISDQGTGQFADLRLD